ncbi:MAG: hypothetical protein QXD03_02215 [Candidatus Anstonellales archaeon]
MGLFSKSTIKSAGKILDKFHDALSSHYEGFSKTFKEHLKSDEAKQVKEKAHKFFNLSKDVFDKLSDADKKALSEHAATLFAMKEASKKHKIPSAGNNRMITRLGEYINSLALNAAGKTDKINHNHLIDAYKSLADIIPGHEYSKMFEPGWKKKAAVGAVGGTLGGAGVTVAAKSVYDYLKSKEEEQQQQ